MRLDLLDRVHRHRNHDQHRSPAKVERHTDAADQDFRQQADRGQIGGTKDKNAVDHIFQIFLGLLAGADAGNRGVLVLQVLGHIIDLEADVQGVEVGEEDDHRRQEHQVQRLAIAQVCRKPGQDRIGRATRKGADRRRQKQQGRGEDRRDNARRVDLDRQVGRAALINLHADLTAGIKDRDLAQRTFHEDHEGDDRDHHDDHAKDHRGREHARPALLQKADQRMRDFRDDADEDDQADAVADAAGRDLFTQPHQEHRAADQRDHAGGDEEEARRMGQIAALDRHRNAVTLEQGQRDGAIAGVLVKLLAALFAFFAKLHPGAVHRAQKLHDDRGRDIGHDPQREDAHPLDGTAGEQVQHPADPLTRLFHELAQGFAVDAGDRDIGAKPVDHQQANGEEDALAQVRRLAQRSPAEVGRHLLCRRCHVLDLFQSKAPPDRSPVGGAGKLLEM